MYSYNNIIAKQEPPGKERLSGIIYTDAELPVEHRPYTSTQWRFPTATSSCGGSSSQSSSHGDPSDDDVIMIENFLLPSECQSIIDCCEDMGFTFWADASADRHSSKQKKEGEEETELEEEEQKIVATNSAFRTAYTVEVHLQELANRLWTRLSGVALGQIKSKAFSPSMPRADDLFEKDMEGTWEPVGICDNILLARYRNGGHFAPHVDGSDIIDLNTRTLYTILVYLNDCDGDGETFILSGDQCNALKRDEQTGHFHSNPETRIGAVVPRRGRAAVFYHNVLHEGSPVAAGHEKYILRADVLYRRSPPILTEPNDIKAFETYQEARVLEASGRADLAVKKFQSIKRLSPGVAALYDLL